MTSPSADAVKYISPSDIRRMFNESQYPGMIADRTLTPEYLRDAHLTNPEAVGEPFCTRGQMIRYYDSSGQWIVEVFQYLRQDKTIGGSGRQDPKRLRSANAVFAVEVERRS